MRRNGYYAWKGRKPGAREAQAKRLDETLRQRFEAHQGRYGSPRLTAELKAEGWRIGRPRVAKRMRALGLKARAAKKYKATTQSKHNLPVAPNRLEQDFTAHAPNQKWVSDITDLWTGAGWLYLAVVLDLYSRSGRRVDVGANHPRPSDTGSDYGRGTTSAKGRVDRPLGSG